MLHQKKSQSYRDETGAQAHKETALDPKCSDVVYPKAWTSKYNIPPINSTVDLEKTQDLFDANKHWICDDEKMKLIAKRGVYMHCLPCDRGFEVANSVIDGPKSVVFDQAENRLHGQKAVMALTMR